MTITLQQLNKENGQIININDMQTIDENNILIQETINSLPTTYGSIVESSETNGNIKIDSVESVVYVHPSGTNPHGTTKSDVGLGNVTNESKAIMFTNPTFVGAVREGDETSTGGASAHAEGQKTIANGAYSHAEGRQTSTQTSATASHVEGSWSKANGAYSHAEGNSTTASGEASHTEGTSTRATGINDHAEGNSTTASGGSSHAEGWGSIASGNMAHASGSYTTANNISSTAIGRYNKSMIGNSTTYSATSDAFVIGNGTDTLSLSNAFRVTFDGKTYGLSAFNSSGADYSEYFEWQDGNVDKEDRVGYFVTWVDSEVLSNFSLSDFENLTDKEQKNHLEAVKRGEKIRKATARDEDILGIISATPSIIGDSCQDDWKGKYQTDEWGRIKYHEVIVDATYKTIDGKKVEVTPKHTDIIPILNLNWNETTEYVPREKRLEWVTVGMLGKLLVRDDGTCQVNGYCKPNNEGIATKSDTGYRVINRISNNIIKVLFR